MPCTLSYPLVLESASLIEEYLSRQGGPHFVDVRDEFERPASWLGFISGLAELDVQVHVRFGRPLDPFGNTLDVHGVSRDSSDRPIVPVRYVLVDGAVARDEARDAEYTRALAARLLAAYRCDSVALPSGVLAFALFNCLRRRHPRLDLFRLLRVLGPTVAVPMSELEPEIDAVLAALEPLAAGARIRLAPELAARGKAAVMEQGVSTLCAYHRPPVLRRRADAFEVTQPTLLLYYRNRLEGYGLPGSFTLPRASEQAGSWGPG